MSEKDDNHIRDRLQLLSQVQPTQEAADRAVQRTRDTLTKQDNRRQSIGTRIYKTVFRGTIPKLAAAAVLLIGAGYITGRISAPETINVEELRTTLESSLKSSLEPAIRQELLKEMDNRWQSALAANRAALKEELYQQISRDLKEFADQTLVAVGTLTDRRLMELAQSVEAARLNDRQRVAAALDYMGSRFGSGLVTLAAHTNEPRPPGPN